MIDSLEGHIIFWRSLHERIGVLVRIFKRPGIMLPKAANENYFPFDPINLN